MIDEEDIEKETDTHVYIKRRFNPYQPDSNRVTL